MANKSKKTVNPINLTVLSLVVVSLALIIMLLAVSKRTGWFAGAANPCSAANVLRDKIEDKIGVVSAKSSNGMTVVFSDTESWQVKNCPETKYTRAYGGRPMTFADIFEGDGVVVSGFYEINGTTGVKTGIVPTTVADKNVMTVCLRRPTVTAVLTGTVPTLVVSEPQDKWCGPRRQTDVRVPLSSSVKCYIGKVTLGGWIKGDEVACSKVIATHELMTVSGTDLRISGGVSTLMGVTQVVDLNLRSGMCEDVVNRGSKLTYEGTLSAVNSTEGTFVVTLANATTRTIKICNTRTTYSASDGSGISFSNMTLGDRLSVVGATSATDGSVVAVSVQDGDLRMVNLGKTKVDSNTAGLLTLTETSSGAAKLTGVKVSLTGVTCYNSVRVSGSVGRGTALDSCVPVLANHELMPLGSKLYNSRDTLKQVFGVTEVVDLSIRGN